MEAQEYYHLEYYHPRKWFPFGTKSSSSNCHLVAAYLRSRIISLQNNINFLNIESKREDMT